MSILDPHTIEQTEAGLTQKVYERLKLANIQIFSPGLFKPYELMSSFLDQKKLHDICVDLYYPPYINSLYTNPDINRLGCVFINGEMYDFKHQFIEKITTIIDSRFNCRCELNESFHETRGYFDCAEYLLSIDNDNITYHYMIRFNLTNHAITNKNNRS